MEKTILNINDEYCWSFEQLQSYFSRELEPDAPLVEELLTLYEDGVLRQWLSEGKTDKEKEVLVQIDDLSKDSSRDFNNDEWALFSTLRDIITEFNGGPNSTLNVFDYLEIEEVKCIINEEEKILKTKSSYLYEGDFSHEMIDSKDGILKVSLVFKIKRKKKIKHTFKMRLESEHIKAPYIFDVNPSKSEKNFDLRVDSILIRTRVESMSLKADNEFWKKVQLIFNYNKAEFNANGVPFVMVAIKGGSFMMGATSEQFLDSYRDEEPSHQVKLSDYYIGETQVTQDLWYAVMEKNPSFFKGDPNRPVERVSWKDCQKFISKLNELTGQKFRLPTEAEWEFAARGGNLSKGFKYAGSNNLDKVAWYQGNSDNQTHPVGNLQPNELGIYDMSGNVGEWCNDKYGRYSSEYIEDPIGPAMGTKHVFRGGSWGGDQRICRVSRRCSQNSTFANDYIGLRLALSDDS